MAARRLLPMTGGLAMAGALVAGVYLHGGERSSAVTVRPPLHLGTPLETGPRTLGPERQKLQAFVAANPGQRRCGGTACRDRAARGTRDGNGGLVIDAEVALRRALGARASYEGERILAALLLSQHRFGRPRRSPRVSAPSSPRMRGCTASSAMRRWNRASTTGRLPRSTR